MNNIQILNRAAKLACKQAISDNEVLRAQRTRFVDLDLRGADLSGLDLGCLEFENVNMSGAIFERGRLPVLMKSTLVGLQASDSSLPALMDCDVREARLERTRFGIRLSNCDLSHSHLTCAHLISWIPREKFEPLNSNFSYVMARGFRACGTNLSGATFGHANLQYARLTSSHLVGADMRGADLRGANLIGAAIEGVRFEGAQWEGAVVTQTQYDELRVQGLPVSGAQVHASVEEAEIAKLVRHVSAMSDLYITWNMRSLPLDSEERVSVWKEPQIGELISSMPAKGSSDDRMSFGWHCQGMTMQILELSNYYAGWRFVPASLVIRGSESSDGLKDAVLQLCTKLFP